MDSGKEEMMALLDRVNELSYEIGFNPFDNYNFRLLGLEKIIDDFNIFEDFQFNTLRTGRDAYSKSYENIEIKTSKLTTKKLTKNSGVLEFDKQNDEIRRKETLKYDALILAIHKGNEPTPVAIFILKSDDAINTFKKIVRDKQEYFIEQWDENHSNDKRGRDSIQININEIIENLNNNDEDIIIINGEIISIENYNNSKYFEV